VTNGIPLVNPAHITEVGIEPDQRKTVSKATAERLKSYIMSKGDIVIGRRGEMGRCAVVTDIEDGWLCGTGSFFIKPSSRCDARYLVRFLRSEACKARLEKMAGGAVMPNLSNTDLGNFTLDLPPLHRQRDIVEKIDSLHEETQRLAAIYERKLAALDALKKSLLHQAFTGELTKDWRESKIIAFPQVVPGITTTDLHAGLLAMAYRCHEMHGREDDFGHVKGEKIAHLLEALVGLELDRTPVRDAAGPNDFPHLQKVEHRARMADFFSFKRAEGSGAYRVTKLRKFDDLVERTERALGERKGEVDRLLETMVKMDWRQAEIFATVFAAWNNLLLDGNAPSDEEIVRAAREEWHPDKLKIDREKFFKAIKWMREHAFVPLGRGKKVVAKAPANR